MGRVSYIQVPPYSVLDLYRYSAAGTHDVTVGDQTYFSVDGGHTFLQAFAASAGSYDLGSWSGSNGNDAANAYFATGVIEPFSTTDITTMETLGWTVAATGPSAPTVNSISPDTGSSSTDHITTAVALAVTGTAEANSTVNIYDGSSQSGTYLGNTTADVSGNWTFNTGTLAAGAHSLTATATDSNGTSADSTP